MDTQEVGGVAAAPKAAGDNEQQILSVAAPVPLSEKAVVTLPAACLPSGGEASVSCLANTLLSRWRAYIAALRSDPLRTKSLTAGTLLLLSDVSASWLRSARGSPPAPGSAAATALRRLRFFLFGFVWSGPSLHVWQRLVERVFHGASQGPLALAGLVRGFPSSVSVSPLSPSRRAFSAEDSVGPGDFRAASKLGLRFLSNLLGRAVQRRGAAAPPARLLCPHAACRVVVLAARGSLQLRRCRAQPAAAVGKRGGARLVHLSRADRSAQRGSKAPSEVITRYVKRTVAGAPVSCTPLPFSLWARMCPYIDSEPGRSGSRA